MPATLFILNHWKKQHAVFLQNLEGLRKQDKENTIDMVHDLRVATKKLRSYLKLLTILLDKKDYTSLFEKTEQLFSVLGKHRDIEMGLALLQAFEKGNKSEYITINNHLKKVYQQTWTWVQNALENYDEKDLAELSRQIEEDLKNKEKEELLQKIRDIVDKELNKAKRFADHLSRQAHLVRKHFKDIFYWASLLPRDILEPDQLKSIKKSLEQLGDWQDHEMLQRKVKHFRKDFVPDAREEHPLLKDLEKTIADKKEKILDKAGENIQKAF